jgi:hypothetical protein
MTQDTEQRSYRGVKCLYCRQPIPISPRVAVIEFELRDNETPLLTQIKCQMFRLRCMACGKEKPYIMEEIREFDGTPVVLRPSDFATNHKPIFR